MLDLDDLIQKEKERVTDGILLILSVFAIALLSSLLRAIDIGWQPIMYLQVGIVLSLWSLYFFRSQLPYNFRSLWVVMIFFVAGIGGVLQFGLVGNGMTWMIIGPVIGTLLFSRRVGVMLVATGAVAISAIGIFVVSTGKIPDIDIARYLTSPSSWVAFLFSFAFVSSLLVVGVSKLNEGLKLALEAAAVRNHEVESLIDQRTKELELANKELMKLAQHDSLTGMLNRGTFVEKLEYELDRVARNRGELSLLMLDVDHFKKINDTYGHLIGDKVLISTAEIMGSIDRKLDVIGRLGGEEFAIFLPDTSLEGALVIAERLRHEVENTQNQYDGHNITLTISIGVAAVNQGDTVSSFIGRADRALYQAKNNGRNCIECQ